MVLDNKIKNSELISITTIIENDDLSLMLAPVIVRILVNFVKAITHPLIDWYDFLLRFDVVKEIDYLAVELETLETLFDQVIPSKVEVF